MGTLKMSFLAKIATAMKIKDRLNLSEEQLVRSDIDEREILQLENSIDSVDFLKRIKKYKLNNYILTIYNLRKTACKNMEDIAKNLILSGTSTHGVRLTYSMTNNLHKKYFEDTLFQTQIDKIRVKTLSNCINTIEGFKNYLRNYSECESSILNERELKFSVFPNLSSYKIKTIFLPTVLESLVSTESFGIHLFSSAEENEFKDYLDSLSNILVLLSYSSEQLNDKSYHYYIEIKTSSFNKVMNQLLTWRS